MDDLRAGCDRARRKLLRADRLLCEIMEGNLSAAADLAAMCDSVSYEGSVLRVRMDAILSRIDMGTGQLIEE